MTEINLEDFTEFSKIKDIWCDCLHDNNGLREFLNNVVMNDNYDNGHGKMLSHLSDIYVLVSNRDFPFEKVTTSQQMTIDLSVAKKNFVLGYIWLSPHVIQKDGCVACHFIYYIDSRISGLNIARHMMNKYEDDKYLEHGTERYLFPFEVIMSAKYYWKKYFMDVYKTMNKQELLQMMCDYGIDKKDVRWEELMSSFKN